MPVDVNLDFVINLTDIKQVEGSPYYNIILSDESTCPLNADGQRICGRANVNFDGFVNQLDTTAITVCSARDAHALRRRLRLRLFLRLHAARAPDTGCGRVA